jgi:phosphoribosylformylglycinamidine synthase subunit PurS
MNYVIEVGYKQKSSDGEATHVLHDVHDSGITDAMTVRTYALFSIEGDVAADDIGCACDTFLHDPVLQHYAVYTTMTETKQHGTYAIDIWFKQGVTDTVGQTIERGMRTIGITKSVTVKTGQRIIIDTAATKKTIEEIATRLLVNGTIHDYTITPIG